MKTTVLYVLTKVDADGNDEVKGITNNGDVLTGWITSGSSYYEFEVPEGDFILVCDYGDRQDGESA